MIYLQLFISFLQVGLFSVGGGYAAMPLIQNQVVELHPWLTLQEFTDLITIAEMTPGPIAVNSATFVGIRIAGIPGAIIATLGCITNPYFSAMFREFEAAARAANYSVFLCNTAFFSSADIATPPPELEYFRMMLDKKVDGVLIVGGQVDLLKIDPEYKAALQHLASNVPTVVLGQQIPDIDCLFIQRESGRGVSFAIDYLAALGHKHIAFVGGENGVDITASRLSAYWDALDALRLPKDRNLVAISDYYTKDGYNAMRELLSRGCEFTAALTVNDSVAFGAYRALADVGLRVPEDISIISCDQFFSADYYVPRLTSINQHNEHFGRFVINALLGIINGIKENVRVVMTPELVLRESCAPPLSRKAKPVQTE